MLLPILRKILFTNLLLASRLAQAQGPAWQTAITTGNQSFASNSVVNATVVDAAGNVYLAGSFSGTVAFGSTVLTSSGPYNTFVAKWSPASSSFVWVQQGITPGSGYSAASAVAVQGSSVYIAGYFTGDALSFGSVSLANAGTQYRDFYVLKLSDLGAVPSVRWGWRAGGSGEEEALGLALNGEKLYVTGLCSPGASFEGTVPTNRGGYDAFVARLTDAGSSARFDWVQTAGGAANDEAQAIVVSGDALYITGFFYGAATFGRNTITSLGDADAYVARLTDEGVGADVDWVEPVGGPGVDAAPALALGGGSLYLAGSTQSTTLTLGSLVLPTGSALSGFVAKLTETGGRPQFGWAARLGGPGAAVQVSNSQVYVAGYFGTGTLPAVSSSASFGSTTLSSYGAYDAYVAGLRDQGSTGQVLWALQAGGGQNDQAYTLTKADARVYVGGLFNGPYLQAGSLLLTQNPTVAAALFLASFADQALPTQASSSLAGLVLYPNPARSTATVRVPAGPGPVTLTVHDALGRLISTELAATGQEHTLHLTGLAPGVYALRVQLGETLATQRLVVE